MSTSKTYQQSLAEANSKTRPPMLERGLQLPRLQDVDDLEGDDLLYYDAEMELTDMILLSIPNEIYNSVDSWVYLLENTSSYYVTHPPSVVDYDEEFEQDDVHNHSEDPLASAMLLLAKAITQNFSNPTNNHLRASSNTRNQAVVQGDRVNIQSRNSGNVGRNNQRAYVQGEVVEGMNATNETANVQRIVRTPTPSNTSTGQCYNCGGCEEFDQNSDDEPSYESAFVSEVQSASINENDEQAYWKMELENSQNNALAKLPMLKLGEYVMWEIRIKQYFQIQNYALWEVIENGNSWVPIPVTAPESGPSTTLKMIVPSTAEEKICKKNDVKARSLLLMALPNEHQLTFDQYVDAQSMFVAIKARFGGNKATRKTQKALLKQQYENFNVSSLESLDSIFNRLQKLVSRLAILGVVTPPEDLNVKFLRSLPSEWDTHVVVWMNKPDFDTMGLDDLYNDFKIVEQKNLEQLHDEIGRTESKLEYGTTQHEARKFYQSLEGRSSIDGSSFIKLGFGI
ncbi:hypothetical protein Tco_0986222 [Tanacetum coccineum]